MVILRTFLVSLRKGSMSFSLQVSEGLFCEEAQDLFSVVSGAKTRAIGLRFHEDRFYLTAKKDF